MVRPSCFFRNSRGSQTCGLGEYWRVCGDGVLLDRALSVLQERLFDLRYGTDTVSFAELDGLTIRGQNAAEGTPYQPTRLRFVRQVLSALRPPQEGAFVDFGCGKGRVLLLAADYGYRRVTGVEFAKELC
jgi:hypothetical protein